MTFLEIIRRTIEEHRRIRADLGSVGVAMNDLEGIFAMQRSHSGWAQSSVEDLPRNVDRLQESVDAVSVGLKRHFGFEEQYLPPVFGETLMKALILEHDDIRGKLSSCGASIVTDIKGMPQERLLAHRSSIQQAISDLIQSIEAHASKEDSILRMMERALEADEKPKGG